VAVVCRLFVADRIEGVIVIPPEDDGYLQLLPGTCGFIQAAHKFRKKLLTVFWAGYGPNFEKSRSSENPRIAMSRVRIYDL
jgi:hypothetical protein